MRVWDLSPHYLCRKHLLGEHREIHALWNILTQGKKGYSHHPETKRWEKKLRALFLRHEKNVSEMERRGYKHDSDLDKKLATGQSKQDHLLHTIEEQKEILKKKGCRCSI